MVGVSRAKGLWALAAVAVGVEFALYRHWHLRWGATDDEVAAAMPGDELVPSSQFTATRALTIDAPPSDVWPWLTQVGIGRAGFYSYDWLDNHTAGTALTSCSWSGRTRRSGMWLRRWWSR